MQGQMKFLEDVELNLKKSQEPNKSKNKLKLPKFQFILALCILISADSEKHYSKRKGGLKMAKIQNVDYEAMPRNAKQMRTYGQQLNTEVKNAYNSVKDMHSSWYGKRYNELVKHFNDMIPQINEMLQLVVTDIPVSLEKVANNYSQADRGSNATTVENTTPNKVTNIEIQNDVGMKFITANVQQVQTKVSNNFKNFKGEIKCKVK